MPALRSTPHLQSEPEDLANGENQAREAAIDSGLVRKFVSGDESAFTEIVNRYRGRIHGLTMNLLRNAADAEEITQDTFIRAYRGLANFRGDSSLSTWLHRIVVNAALDRLRRRAVRPAISADEPTFEGLAAHDPDPAGAVGLEWSNRAPGKLAAGL